MVDDRIRIRVNLSQGELELEGSAALLKQYEVTLQPLLEKLLAAPTKLVGSSKGSEKPPTASSTLDIPEAFGEFFHMVPKGAKKADQLLAAAFFVQQKSPDGIYTVADAASTLVNVGVKLSNPNEFNRLNKEAKLVFSMGPGKWKVADGGIDRLKSLLTELADEEE
jgi:hypothetical protein